ncbi:MAG: M48 family metalloprotease, partial [Vicinamibacterales bacterium]
MNTLALASIVVLASFALLYFAAALVARRSRAPAPDAGRLFARAVWPTLVPVFVAALVLLPSFLWHEAPQQDEWPGAILVLLALAGGARLGVNLIRAIRTLVASRALVRAWQRGATPLPHEPWGLRASKIDTGFPVVAVAGLFTPHVFVDRRVLDACSPAELAAVAAHERAHVAVRDNLRRLMIAACAGLASDTAVAWRAAAERAAD